MKCRVIRYARSKFLTSVLHSQIVCGGSPYSWTSFLEEVGHSIIYEMPRFKVTNAEFWIEFSESDFEISHVNE